MISYNETHSQAQEKTLSEIMDLRIKGKRALITAASEGIGRGAATQIQKEGVKLGICARNLENLQRVAKELEAEFYESCDLEDSDSLKHFMASVNSKWGHPEILIINTPGPPKKHFSDVSLSDWELGFKRIWQPTLQLIEWVLPSMKKQHWGRIVILTSLAAREPIPNNVVSGPLRAGLSNFVKSLAREVAKDGITINAVLPGWTATTGVKKMGAAITPIVEQIPALRLAEPEEIGAVVTFLCSHPAAYLTGQAIAVDGGLLRGG